MTLLKVKKTDLLDFKELNQRKALLMEYLHGNHSSALEITNPSIGTQMVTVKFEGPGYKDLLLAVVTDMQSFGIPTRDFNSFNQGVSLDWPEKVVELGFVEKARETSYKPAGSLITSVKKPVAQAAKATPVSNGVKVPAVLSLSELEKKKTELEKLLSENLDFKFVLSGVSEKGQHTFLSLDNADYHDRAQQFIEKEGISCESMMPTSFTLIVKLNTVGDFDTAEKTTSPKDPANSTSSHQNGSISGSVEEEEAESASNELRDVPKLTRSFKIQIGKKIKEKLEEENLDFTPTASGENDKAMVFASDEEGKRAKEVLKGLGITKFGKVADDNHKTVKIFDLGQAAHLIGISVPKKRGFNGPKKSTAKKVRKSSGLSPNGTNLNPDRLPKEDQRPIKKMINGLLVAKGIAWKYSSDPRADYVLSFDSSDDADAVKELLKQKGVSEFGRTRKDYVVRIIDLSELAHHAGVSALPKPARNTASAPSARASKSYSLSDQKKIQLGYLISKWLKDAGLAYKASYGQNADKTLRFESASDAEKAKDLFRNKGVTKEFGRARKDTIVKIVDLSELKHHLDSGSPATASSGSSSSAPISTPAAPAAASVDPPESVDADKLASEILKALQKENIVLSQVSIDTSKNKIEMKSKLVKEPKLLSLLKEVIKNH